MRIALLFLSFFLITTTAFAQEWRTWRRGALFATYVTETGPRTPQTRLFSTNWFEGGASHGFGANAAIEFRGRVSLEPLTVPREGYPQLLQYVSPSSGGPLTDRMRAQDLVQEVAMRASWRALRLDLAPVGDPPLGATPYAQRTSSIDFAEAPFAYDVQESFHLATRVIGAAADTKTFAVEGAVFHASTTTGRHTTIADGGIDSWSGRLTIRPVEHLAIQASRGSLGDAHRNVTSASVTYEGAVVAASAIWTQRDTDSVNKLTSYALELSMRRSRNALSLRIEAIDRPAGTIYPTLRRTAHFTIGDVVEVLRTRRLRTGIGVNIDYQTQTRELQATYGHKPQSIYTFVRLRTE
ncbi:MAG: hypothetical protein QOC81_1588 [Thermoanaerobaculia bacterium]|jgi:hypothetical protein|nr:hypothetical protein [Thermoanaerobaculia bacterium]